MQRNVSSGICIIRCLQGFGKTLQNSNIETGPTGPLLRLLPLALLVHLVDTGVLNML